MTRNGHEVDTMVLDKNLSTVEVCDTIREYNITTRFKRYSIRIKVANSKDEMTQYLMFTDMIHEKLTAGLLFIRDDDASTQPSFGHEYRRNLKDGSYYIVRRYCEIVL